MAVSPMKKDSKPISSSRHKINQKTWDKKKKLAKERLMGLTDKKIDEESMNVVDKRIKCYSTKKVKATGDHINNCDDASTTAMGRALGIMPNSPRFLKNMSRSHVTCGFWLGLPKKFCVDHLPKCDKTIVLVGENETEHYTNYLVDKRGLSGGWRGFSIAHKLVEGDVLVFELLNPCKFKVHIARASEFKSEFKSKLISTLTEEDDAARCLLNLHAEPIETEKEKTNVTLTEEDDAARCFLNLHAEPIETVKMEEEEEPEETTETLAPKKKRKLILADDDDELSPGITNGITFSESFVHFKDVKCFDDFKIQADGLILDSEISKHFRKKYYDLCVSQNKFLHENLVKGLNSKLVAGVISETINIADAIRAANKPATVSTDLEGYDRTLKAFEELGMEVGFLRARIGKLLGLSRELQSAIESKRNELDAAEDEMRGLKVLMEKLVGEIYGLKEKNEKLGVVFADVAGEPW